MIDRVADLRARLDHARDAGQGVGLVPTMGSLHQGHLSLVQRAAEECDVVAVSVFVNPLQFGPGEDLDTYPRTLEADIGVVAGGGGDLVFAPTVAEMYPAPPSAPTGYRVPGLTDVYEGASRPGHFSGVATVVTRLFEAAGPCRAYFGEKDWQQLLVVRRLVDELRLPVQVVACPTVRDGDGLACSSRNRRLSAEERTAALALSRSLAEAATRARSGERDADMVRRHLVDSLARAPLVDLDYAAVVRAGDLSPLDRLAGEVRLLVAAHVGTTRLIDNMGVTVEPAAGDSLPDHRRSA